MVITDVENWRRMLLYLPFCVWRLAVFFLACKICGGLEVLLHAFFTSLGRWLNLQASLDPVAKTFFCPHCPSNFDPSVTLLTNLFA